MTVEPTLRGQAPALQLLKTVSYVIGSILLFVALAILFLLRLQRAERNYFEGWRRNWQLGAFVGLALLSLSWTVFFPGTIYRVSLLLFISLIGAYMGMRFTARNLVNFLGVLVGVIALASLMLAAALPKAAIMTNHAYEGLWRGVFWHKIYLGATMALGYIAYLVILFSPRTQYSPIQKSLAALMLVIGAVLAVVSDSASGLLVYVIQTVLFILILMWLSWGRLISRRMYWFLAAGGLSILLLIATNLEFVFGLFNRSASMTGRVPMWIYLLESYLTRRPLVGYGFGTFWLQPGIKDAVQAVVGWYYPVTVSDNGYMDILLGLGAAGLLLLLAILATGFARAVRMAKHGHDLMHFFPLLVMVHIFFINLSLSYFMEFESFVWFLLVVVLFMSQETPDGASISGHAQRNSN